jgi:hypothetical protein
MPILSSKRQSSFAAACAPKPVFQFLAEYQGKFRDLEASDSSEAQRKAADYFCGPKPYEISVYRPDLGQSPY